MYLTERHVVSKKNNLKQWQECDKICFLSKNLYNQILYRSRQYFIENKKNINFNELNKQMVAENQVDYRAISARSSNSLVLLVQQNMKSFFSGIKDYAKHPIKYKKRPKLPTYLDKENGRQIITFDKLQVKIKNGIINFPKKETLLPIRTKIKPENFVMVRIVPQASCYVMEILYEQKEVINEKLNYDLYMAIDLGIKNLCTITTNKPGLSPLLIKGTPIVNNNAFYNKQVANFQSKLKDENKKTSNRIKQITLKRNNQMDTYMHQTSKKIIDYCIENNIGNIVVGKNKGWKVSVNIGSINNQKFVQIPFENLISKIIYKAELVGIKVIKQEESYTSKCSALDLEPICKHVDEEGKNNYVGKRQSNHKFFKTAKGKIINADVNGSLNINRKVIGNDFISLFNGGLNAVNPSSFIPGKQNRKVKNTI